MGAQHVVDQQCLNGGWGYPHDDCGVTYHNITAPIALGLIRVWELHGSQPLLDAAQAGGDYDLTGVFLDSGDTNFDLFTPAFFHILSGATGDPTYSDNAAADFFDKLTAGTYGDPAVNETYYPGDTYDYIDLNKSLRIDGMINLRPWDMQYMPWVAGLIGNPDSSPGDGVSQHDTFLNDAVLDGLDTLDASDPGTRPWDLIGLTGGVHALALDGTTLFTPLTAVDFPALTGIDNLCDLADVLASYQNPDGSWYWASGLVMPDVSDEDTQTTSYAIRALALAQTHGCGPYTGEISLGRSWLASMQDVDGGYFSSPGGPHNTEIEGEVLTALASTVADLAVAKTVSDDHPIEGDEIVYTITVTNDGPAGATGVTVDDLLPAGVTFVGVDSIDQGAYDEVLGVWDVGDLADGGSVQLAVRASVDEGTAEATGTGEFIDVFASGGGLERLQEPQDVTFGPDGNLYVTSSGSDEVLRYDGTTGAFIDVFASGAGLNSPWGLIFGPDGNLYVASAGSGFILRYDGASGAFLDEFASGGGLNVPAFLTFGPDGNLYVAQPTTHQILRYDGATGAFLDVFASGLGLNQPIGLVFGPDENLYVSNGQADAVHRFDGMTGEFLDVFANDGGLDRPQGLLFGPDGSLYVASASTDEVLRYDGATGAFVDVFAAGDALDDPRGLTFGPDGNLYVACWPLSMIPRYQGFITNFATVSAATPDPDALDNLDFAGIVVGGPFAFEAPYDSPAEGEPLVHVVGDLDTELSSGGTIDVAVLIPDPDPQMGGAVQIFLNLGNDVDGTWLGLDPQLPVIPVGADPSDIAAGDFNGDDYLDLAVTNAFDGTVSILLNAADGSGSFVAGPVIPGFDTPSAIAAADFLGSGAIDIAVAESGSANVEYLENDGSGTFTPIVGVIVGAMPIALDPQDIDDDKDVDAVAANFGGDSLTVIMNGGGVSFPTLPDIAVGAGPVDLAIGDLDFDGLADLVSANNGDGTVSIVRNLGPAGDGAGDGGGEDGPPLSFAPAMNLAAGAMPQSVDLVDLDGDQDLDIVVVATAAQVGPALLLFENLFVGGGGLTFAPPVAMSIGADPESVLSGDFNGDGAIDLVTVNVDGSAPSGGSVTVILNTVFPCPGDLDANGGVGFSDILTLLGLWGPCKIGITCEGDLDIDGSVGFSDLLILLGGWGECP